MMGQRVVTLIDIDFNDMLIREKEILYRRILISLRVGGTINPKSSNIFKI